MSQDVYMANVWQRVGVLTHTGVLAHGLVPRPRGDPHALVFAWPKEFSYVRLRVRYGPESDRLFPEGPEAAGRALAAVGPVPEGLDEFFGRNHVMSAVVPGDAPVILDFEVDTNDETFCRDAAGGAGADTGLVRSFAVLSFGGERGEGEIRLVMVPGLSPPDYEGCVALDLGDSSCSLACVGLGGARAGDIRLLDPGPRKSELRATASPVPAAVRFLAVDGTDVRWGIGYPAARGPAGGRVAGLRRLAVAGAEAGPERPPARGVARPGTGGAPAVAFPQHLPAELFVCRMFQDFSAATLRRVGEFALTCPATFSTREVRRLREAVARGWLRMRGEQQTEERLASALDCISLVLDDTSAAAFFFLSQKVFERPGGLPWFRYLYPRGLNLLLYDCGGSAVAAGLVTVRVAPDDPTRLAITTRGHGGLRDFGGDAITREVFRVLKARLALELAKAKNLPGRPPVPADPRARADFLTARADYFDELIPTRFRPGAHDPDNQARRERAWDLWNQAEEVKAALALAPDAPAAPQADGALTRFLMAVTDPAAQHRSLRQGLDRLRVLREEVDELVRGPVLRSVRLCNKLIRRHLTNKEEEVHWAIVLGNGARYPLIPELIRERLGVLFLEDRLTVDVENLKHAAAKGAVLALAALKYVGGVTVEFDSDLARRLPFDVAYDDRRVGTHRTLFQARERYDRLQLREVPLPAGTGARHLVLSRRWPGERQFSAYLAFEFPQGMAAASAVVRYDPDTCQFVAEVGDQRGEVRELAAARDANVACPVESGEL